MGGERRCVKICTWDQVIKLAVARKGCGEQQGKSYVKWMCCSLANKMQWWYNQSHGWCRADSQPLQTPRKVLNEVCAYVGICQGAHCRALPHVLLPLSRWSSCWLQRWWVESAWWDGKPDDTPEWRDGEKGVRQRAGSGCCTNKREIYEYSHHTWARQCTVKSHCMALRFTELVYGALCHEILPGPWI